ncbi:unnamed protein product [Polarella glacialis]|uniref:Uncharacterized protein n=1 Tax=Polarella glacialis TaxID=89957 RepID=A0A813GK43_POLGL|nr:unnamed protein product [Polarella glacialis]
MAHSEERHYLMVNTSEEDEEDEDGDAEHEVDGDFWTQTMRSVTSQFQKPMTLLPEVSGMANELVALTEGGDRTEEEGSPADVFFRVDMYDSVLVAAFGGVTMNLDGNDQLHVYPGLLFIFCIPLVAIQFWLTFAVGFGMHPVWKKQDADEQEQMVISMKLLLMLVVQLTFFDNLLMTLRCLMFAMNPTTWTDIKRVDPDDPKIQHSLFYWLHWSGFIAPAPICALMMKIWIQYWVSVQSCSIILASDGIKEAIFDSLAIGFIIELDVAMWQVVATVMHLDSFENFSFELWPLARRKMATRESMFAHLCDFKILHRGHGARRFENCLTFVVIFLIYSRLLFICLLALDSGLLPAARDVCQQWKRHVSEDWGDKLLGAGFKLISHVFASLSFFDVDFTDELNRMADPERGGYCTDEYAEMDFSKAKDLLVKFQRVVISSMVTFTLLLLLPQLFYSTGAMQKAIEHLDVGGVTTHKTHQDNPAALAAQSAILGTKKLKELKLRVAEQFHEMHHRILSLESAGEQGGTQRPRAGEFSPVEVQTNMPFSTATPRMPHMQPLQPMSSARWVPEVHPISAFGVYNHQ